MFGWAHGKPPASRVPFLVDSTLESCPNTFDQNFIVEWFRQELYGTCPQGLKSHVFIAMRCDKDRRNPAMLSVQPSLQLQAGHTRHADIRDQTSGIVLVTGPEECLS
jgi:hypothetical protein